ncbi:MAG: hypothetical protein JWN30_599 [Bacilli bacterium]|nr:hypothetical protein [Bacilli bacterium]
MVNLAHAHKRPMRRRMLLSIMASMLTLSVLYISKPSLSFAASLVVDSLDGPVTQNEINSYNQYLPSIPLPVNNYTPGNDFVYGKSGEDVESMGIMYEITHDTTILDTMIHFADTMLAARNDPNTGRILWNGQRDLVWPNKSPDATNAGYSGSENGDVIAHISYCAKLILQDPSLWNTNVSFGDPDNLGATYLQRAQTYVTELDQTEDTYMIPNFIHSGTNLQYWPSDPAWDSNNYGTPGTPIPWNQQMMINGGFQRLADCHLILGDDSNRVSQYNAIVQASVNWFTNELTPYQSGNGDQVYTWNYASGDTGHVEDANGVHAAYDLMGMVRAYESGRYGVTSSTLTGLANTVLDEISTGNGDFYNKVNGDPSSGTLARLWSEYLHIAPYNALDYKLICNSSFMSVVPSSPSYFARIMLMKTVLNSSGNLALGKSYSASTTWSSSYPASNAFDGKLSTRWASTNPTNQWLNVDFGIDTTYNQVVLNETSFQRVTSYTLQSSEGGSTYTDIPGTAGTTIGSNKTINFSPVTSRYLRLNLISASGDPTINEMAVYDYPSPVNDSDSSISYSSGWNYSSNRGVGDYNNDVHYTAASGNSASFTFFGKSVEYVTEENTDEGNVDVYIDGVLDQTVNCYNAARVAQQAVYSKSWSTPGTHTIKIVQNSGHYMVLDAFNYN